MDATAHKICRGVRARLDETSEEQTTARWVAEPERS
jgi:hypothetical protein